MAIAMHRLGFANEVGSHGGSPVPTPTLYMKIETPKNPRWKIWLQKNLWLKGIYVILSISLNTIFIKEANNLILGLFLI